MTSPTPSQPKSAAHSPTPSEYLKLKYIGDCKCGDCQLVPATVLQAWENSHASLKARIDELEGALDKVMQRANEGLGDISSLQETIHAMHAIARETRGRVA